MTTAGKSSGTTSTTTLDDSFDFIHDVTFSKPFELDLSFLGKKPSITSLKSAFRSPAEKLVPIQEESEKPVEAKDYRTKELLEKAKKRLKAAFLKYWFLLGLFIAIFFAWLFPNVARKGGYLRAEWSIKWGAVIIIFFISGLSLRTRILAQTILRIRLHFLIQFINLILIPFFVFGLVIMFFKLHTPLNSLLLIGVVIAASTPTTVSSNVVMTKNANGNEASALMNAALGNILGIFVSPSLVSYFQVPLLAASPEDESANTAGGSVDYITVLKQLGLTVLLPLVVGQGIQLAFTEPVAKFKAKARLSDVSSFCLLLMVWSVFSDAIHAGSFSAVAGKDILGIALLNFFFYILFSITCLFLARLPYPEKLIGRQQWIEKIRYSREDTVAVMFCGATKTVAMGVPLINVLYQKGDPGTIGVLSTPLLLYHVEQLILGNIEVEILKKWVLKGQEADKERMIDEKMEAGSEHISAEHSSQSVSIDMNSSQKEDKFTSTSSITTLQKPNQTH
ncbi:SBF-like CPA transporter family-domain-containing protein [Mycotypha africana]|uniref:SBF-like CPA transporter family-domain-containing protein n=1 Tax=Mycotypha africana TaxID=64632 RepID=UPI00230195B9|nr:SBF-like CPA transporter family-domain-containing protein [Mycotypha africana]KAI8971905.1 SBF-like CPA transporter family-domain-containing protein [Mycotypha africana]